MVRRSSSLQTAHVRGDARAVHAWWTDARRLDEMKASWSAQRDFRWHETREGDRVDIATSWTTGSGIEIALHVTLHRMAFPLGRNEIIQRRRHLTGRRDRTSSTTTVEFRQVGPATTELRITTEREQAGWRWWELLPPATWVTDRRARRHLAVRVARCEKDLADSSASSGH